MGGGRTTYQIIEKIRVYLPISVYLPFETLKKRKNQKQNWILEKRKEKKKNGDWGVQIYWDSVCECECDWL